MFNNRSKHGSVASIGRRLEKNESLAAQMNKMKTYKHYLYLFNFPDGNTWYTDARIKGG